MEGGGSIPSAFGESDKRRHNSGSSAAAKGVFTQIGFLTFILTFLPFKIDHGDKKKMFVKFVFFNNLQFLSR